MALRSFTADQSVVEQRLAPGTLRRIARYAVPYKRPLALFLVTIVLDALLIVATPLLFKEIIDKGVIPGNGGLVTRVALVIALLAIADAGLSLVGRWYSSRIGEGLIFDLRTEVFDHVQRQPIAFFTRTQTGALISRINSDVIGAQQAFTSTLSGVISNVISLIMVVGAMAFLSWPITLASVALLPIFLIPARYVGRRIQALTRESFALNATMSATMTERFNVAGALLVTLFGRKESENRVFSERARRVADVGIAIALQNRIFFVALSLIAALATALVYGIGGHLAIDGTLTVGTLLALAALLARLYGPLTALSNVRVDIMTALVSFERVFEVLDLEPMIRNREGAVDLPPGALDVRFDQVGFRYPRAEEISLASLESVAKPELAPSGVTLIDVDFHIAPGQMVALVGPSGAGKTTISSLVARLYDVTSGAIRVGGMDVRDVRLESLHDRVGMVTQEAHLFHESIRENLLYARPGATDAELEDACRRAQIWEMVEALPNGLDTVVGDRGHRLSGGEKQRIAIARLLLKAPAVVILDEATAHLDAENEVAVQRALKEALRDRTSLVIAHRLSTIREADLILVVENGRIIERGTHEHLIHAGGLYAELHRTDQRAAVSESVD
jgi:ATP-binding cassette subfamily B protein